MSPAPVARMSHKAAQWMSDDEQQESRSDLRATKESPRASK